MRRRVGGTIVLLASTALLALSATTALGAAPSITEWTDPPSDDAIVDCGSYEIRERSIFSARAITYADGTVRVHATIEGWLYRTDDPEVVLGRERARTVRLIEGTVAMVTGNRWHIVVHGAGMTVHDVGRLVLDFETREVFAESGKHPILTGELDFGILCNL